jgi:hypothetical protein
MDSPFSSEFKDSSCEKGVFDDRPGKGNVSLKLVFVVRVEFGWIADVLVGER